MAFSVAPTAGGSPYFLSAQFAYPELIDGINYDISVRFSHAQGSCPTIGDQTSLTTEELALLLTGDSVQAGNTVSAGRCRTYTLSLLRVRDGVVLETSNAYVNNL